MIAVLSDLHARPDKFDHAFWPAMTRAEAILCLGDTVGYGKDPGGAIQRVQENCDVVIKGNHDAAATHQLPWFLEGIPDWLSETLERVEELPPEQFEWLASRPLTAEWNGIEMFHASRHDPLMGFLSPGPEAAKHLEEQPGHLSLVGHTHQALAIGSKNGQQVLWDPEGGELDLALADKWVLNPGALGMKAASWLELDQDRGLARWHFM